MSKQFVSLLGEVELELPAAAKKVRESTSRSTKNSALGCDACSLNGKRGLRKVRGLKRVKGRKIFVWAQAPGKRENEEGLELVGPAGNLFWSECAKVGITRPMCDIQNVVRCWPTQIDEEFGTRKDRAPTKEEAKACSVYNNQALLANAGAARVYLVLGQFAAPILLGREYKKDKPIFWSEKLNAHVVCLDHPSYFLRGAPSHRLEIFRTRLKAAAKLVVSPGRFDHLKKQDYKLIRKPGTVKKLYHFLRRKAEEGSRISVDIEDGRIDPTTREASPSGEHVILCIGFSWASGKTRTVVLDHPENKQSSSTIKKVKRAVSRIMTDPVISKVMHHGCHDGKVIHKCLGVKVKNFYFDTNYSTYLVWPDQKKYGLDENSRRHIPGFAGYKDIVKPHIDPKGANYATIPLEVFRLYNGGDCDVTKRLEMLTSKKVSLPLLRTYTEASFTLDRMQQTGPLFDFKHYEVAGSLVRTKLTKIKKRLVRLSEDAEFNPNASQQVADILYNKLRMPVVDKHGAKSTRADVLDLLGQRKNGEFPRLVKTYRELYKMDSTYLSNYYESATLNNGELHTLWWLTGTVTGRLRSGGGEDPGIVNMQNLHGNPLLQNLLVSDLEWRRVSALYRSGVLSKSKFDECWKRLRRMRLFLAYDYGQIEIRILAAMSGDKKLIAAVESGDIHSAVGHELTGWPIDKIKNDKETRTLVKNLHFGIVYGMSKKSLFASLRAKGVKITQARSDELYDKYFSTYRGVKAFVNEVRQFAERYGYVETMFGFRRPIYINQEDSDRSSFWGNQAINSPIQGSAHQLLLMALAVLHNKPVTYSDLQDPVMEIHDALVFFDSLEQLHSAYDQGIKLLTEEVPRYIERVFKFKLSVPLVAEAKAGFRMGSMVLYEGGSENKFCNSWAEYNRTVESKINEEWKIAA